MKNVLMLTISLLITALSFGQLTEGHVNYKIDFSTDNPDMEMALAMMQGSTLELFFKDNQTRSTMAMGTIMNITTVTDDKKGEVLMLMSGMIGKKAVITSLEDIEKANDEEKPEVDVELIDETKEIQGYNCKKAILTDANGMEAVFWYTEEISVNKRGQNYLNEDIPGFPMEFDINQGEMKMHMIVDVFETSLGKKSKELFDMSIPDGYEEMTLEELGQMGM